MSSSLGAVLTWPLGWSPQALPYSAVDQAAAALLEHAPCASRRAGSGLTHASSVISFERSSEAASAIVDAVVDAVEARAPCRTGRRRSSAAPVIEPSLFDDDASSTAAPVPSSKPQAPTRPRGVDRRVVTVTATGAEVRWLPGAVAGDRGQRVRAARADSVSQLNEYGAMVSSAPTLAPSTLNCTPATATLSAALAVRLTVPRHGRPVGRRGDRDGRRRGVGGHDRRRLVGGGADVAGRVLGGDLVEPACPRAPWCRRTRCPSAARCGWRRSA